ncbi:major facilitator superfamily domain-containing protein 12 [Hyalella azteca]|uniref:Major facilitator superfamily domain-containing protein 12 n=1 Tax=Hyalella azteca TaxID=294128 RepID=A0A8B7PGF7_HYAAZ|nr:major facilitator superfamily domain-containing protein 12 [Hyalella azteca]
MDNQKTLKLSTKLSYGVGHVMNDLCASMWFTYLLIYLQYVLQLERRTAGLLLLLGQVADAVSTPLVGLYSDSGCRATCCAPYGRRKTWHAFGSVCVLLSFPFIFIRCSGCLLYPAVYSASLAIFICVFQFGWASVQVSHLALIPDLASCEADRDELNIIRYFFDVTSDVLVYLVVWAVFSEDMTPLSDTLDPSDDYNFMIVTATVMSVGVVFTLVFHAFTPDPVLRPSRTVQTSPTSTQQPSTQVKARKPIKTHENEEFSIGEKNEKQHDGDAPETTATRDPAVTSIEADKDVPEEQSLKTSPQKEAAGPSATGVRERRGSGSSSSLDEFDPRWTDQMNDQRRESQASSEAELLLDTRVQMSWKDWLKEPQFYQISLLYTCSRLVCNVSSMYVPVYLQETQHSTELIALVPLVMSLSGVVATVLLRTFRKCSGKKGSVLTAVMVGLVACLLVLFGGRTLPVPVAPGTAAPLVTQLSQGVVYVVAALLGLSASMLMILSLALTADMIGRCTESSAFVYGCMSFGDKLANGLVVVLVQEVATNSCVPGQPCGWFFEQLLGAGLGAALLVCGVGGASLAVGTLGYTRKMRQAAAERGLTNSSHSPLSSSDSSELLLPTTTQLGYGAIHSTDSV